MKRLDDWAWYVSLAMGGLVVILVLIFPVLMELRWGH
ncbi:Uncharacterised protein [Mycobacteroides abscessus subsp. massiliense]|nr:Uncharacterised protein [Mycobacteroides abscessus subsp. abscessus]SKY02779.1 Uncharacterised protein [Mycobacteroides abscessus subsp. massiliense]SKZ08535.1 Uncharacterised protein [Mycobacteroides abscessus subsp. massiliense]